VGWSQPAAASGLRQKGCCDGTAAAGAWSGPAAAGGRGGCALLAALGGLVVAAGLCFVGRGGGCRVCVALCVGCVLWTGVRNASTVVSRACTCSAATARTSANEGAPTNVRRVGGPHPSSTPHASHAFALLLSSAAGCHGSDHIATGLTYQSSARDNCLGYWQSRFCLGGGLSCTCCRQVVTDLGCKYCAQADFGNPNGTQM
jgi:hypothetical protein